MMTAFQHYELLRREDRTAALYDAVRRTVRPGMRVLDAGTGTGILAIWAAQAGAKQVVAVDSSHSDLARALLKQNRCDETVDFVSADLRQLPLPGVSGRFDVLFGLLYYNDPRRDEAQAELAWRLWEQYLKPGGRSIPDGVEYKALACAWREQDLGSHLLHIEDSIRHLEVKYSVQLGPLRDAIFDPPPAALFPRRDRSGQLVRDAAQLLSPETKFASIDLTAARPDRLYPETVTFTAEASGRFNAVVWIQDLRFEGQTIFRNESMSWVADPVSVERGTRFSVAIDDEWRRTNVLHGILLR